jgi:hypothetical protein
MKKEKNNKLNYTIYTGYILFIATIFGWGISTGILLTKMDVVVDDVKEFSIKLDKQQEILMRQEKLNGEMVLFIEIMKRKYDED